MRHTNKCNGGEDGESCQVEGHECVRTSRAVLVMLQNARADSVRLRSEIEQVATEMGNKDNAGWRMLREWSQRLSALARGGE